jgi:hypothetical protein
MAEADGSKADAETVPSSPTPNSAKGQSIDVPISTPQKDLEKPTGEAVKGLTRSRRRDGLITSAEDWDGPDDPDNPLNWPTPKKIYNTVIPALQCFTITFGSSVYTPSKGVPLAPNHY